MDQLVKSWPYKQEDQNPPEGRVSQAQWHTLRISVLGRKRWKNLQSLLLRFAEPADSRPVRETLS